MVEFGRALRGAILPLMIPVIIIGSILGGVITPAEAGMTAVMYALIVLLPLLNRGHFRRLPTDIAMAAILYAIPLTAVAAASSFGWMLAYLGGADIIMGWVSALGTTDPRAILCFVAVLFLIVGDFLDGLPAIIILMPVILSLERLGHINSVHMGVVVIVTLLRADHAALRDYPALVIDAGGCVVQPGAAAAGCDLHRPRQASAERVRREPERSLARRMPQ